MISRKTHRAGVDVLVVGAGITGCSAAHELQSKGIDYLLLEKNLEPGGLSRSISLGDAQFDYTGHFLHLQHYSTPSAIPYANLDDDDWQRVERRSRVYLNGELIPAPLQYNLNHLPKQLRQWCVDSFHSRPSIDCPASFSEYLLTSFGDGMCAAFLFPYNEKLMACDLGRLTPESAGRFLPPPDAGKIEAGHDQQPGDYNSQFWYPKNSGIGLLAKALAGDLACLALGCPVTRIDPAARQAQTPMGTISYRRMLTSVPLKELSGCTDDEQLRRLGDGLSHNRVASVNVLAKGSLPDELLDAHWVYLPERMYPFYRVGMHSNVADLVPDGYFSMCAEVAALPGSRADRMANVVSGVVDGLDRLGWASRSDIAGVAANWIDCAYVHFTHDRQSRVASMNEILADYGVFPIGRYGTWDYTSMEDCIRQGISAAQTVAAQ